MATAVLDNFRRTESKPYDGFEKMLVNGHWRQGSGAVTEDRDPYTDDVLVRIHVAQEDEVDEAYRAAAAAQGKWAGRLPSERAAVLRRAAAIMEARREEIVDWLIRESGSTRIKANLEWQFTVNMTLEAATFPTRAEGYIIPADIPARRAGSTASRSGWSA